MTAEYTLGQLFFETATKHPQVLAQADPHGKQPMEITYRQLAEQVACLGAGFLNLGVQRGDKVALFSDNKPRWLWTDLALLSIGAVDVPRGTDSATPEFEYILAHSDCIAAVLQDAKLLQRLSVYRKALLKLRFIVLMDDSKADAVAPEGIHLLNFDDVVQRGRSFRPCFEQARSQVNPGDLATIVYTSGTTGTPKGVMLSHRNLTHQALVLDFAVDMVPGDIQLTILPPWHVYERAAEYFGVRQANSFYYTDKRHFREDMEKLRPHLLPCVPRMWEAVYDAIYDKVKKEPERKRKLFASLVGRSAKFVVARRVLLGLDARRKPASLANKLAASLTLAAMWPFHLVGDKLIYHKLRAVTGNRFKAAISGGGSLAPYLDEFFEIVGVTIVNGYGLTEAAPVLTIRPVTQNVRGTVGRPLPGVELQVRDDNGNPLPRGETGIVYGRGPGIMMGYYKNEEGTRQVIGADGWLDTGDLGYLTPSGYLAITGRAKDTIVLASGENVEPDPIETVTRKSPLVNQILVVGQDRKQLGALVVPDFEKLAEALNKSADTPPNELCDHPMALRYIREEISNSIKADGGFRQSEQIARIALIHEPFTEANGMLTQTMKLRRNVITEKYASTVESLFA